MNKAYVDFDLQIIGVNYFFISSKYGRAFENIT